MTRASRVRGRSINPRTLFLELILLVLSECEICLCWHASAMLALSSTFHTELLLRRFLLCDDTREDAIWLVLWECLYSLQGFRIILECSSYIILYFAYLYNTLWNILYTNLKKWTINWENFSWLTNLFSGESISMYQFHELPRLINITFYQIIYLIIEPSSHILPRSSIASAPFRYQLP